LLLAETLPGYKSSFSIPTAITKTFKKSCQTDTIPVVVVDNEKKKALKIGHMALYATLL
jgi:hypothetical protein